VALVVVFAVAVLFMVYRTSQGGAETADGGGGFKHAVGDPGIGAAAPDFTLPAAGGGDISLSDYRGRSVLLYFQEGLMCPAVLGSDQRPGGQRGRIAGGRSGRDRVDLI
jgi:peroxiredoxin Q/BCP